MIASQALILEGVVALLADYALLGLGLALETPGLQLAGVTGLGGGQVVL